MKNNQEKLTDALGLLREDTLHTCTIPAKRPARALQRRRVAVLLAACLTFTLMVGAMLALPFLGSDDPLPPAETTAPPSTESQSDLPSTEGQSDIPPAPSELSWYNAPLVNVQVLALSAKDTENAEDLDMSQTQDISVVHGNRLGNQRTYILFKLDKGETLTATSHNGLIAHSTLLDIDSDDQSYQSWEQKFLRYTSCSWTKNNEVGQQIVIDSPEAFLIWGGNRYYSENPLVFTPDEEFIDFVVRDAEGRITGAGSVYLGNRKTVKNTASRYYDSLSISRGKVLGSVRFNDPASVTEDQVAGFLESLHAQAEEVKKTLFDHLTRSEKFVLAFGDLINTHYGDLNNFAAGSGSSLYDNYTELTIYKENGSQQTTVDYLLMEDGTWGQIQKCLSFCEFCGEQMTACSHHDLEHERFVLTDGRVMDIHHGVINGHGAETLVEVTDTTYQPITEYELMRALILPDSPMVDPVYNAYIAIKAELGEDVIPHSVTEAFQLQGNGTILYRRHAILVVTNEKGLVLRYFVCENGEYGQLDRVTYECEECDFVGASIQVHEHDQYTKIFILTDGGSYVVKGGLADDGKPYAPEYRP